MKKNQFLTFIMVLCLVSACGGPRAILWDGKHAPLNVINADKVSIITQTSPKAVVPVYVATSRQKQNDFSQPFGIKRSAKLNFARVDVGIPQDHKKGLVETNANMPDFQKYFSAVALQRYNDASSFRKQLNTALDHKKKGKREIFLFIHGYNNNFADSTFRAAQFTYDYSLDSITVHYSWPSGGALGLYVYDRDSADFARDGLADLLTLISQTDADKITVIAHSMGNYVLMEAMRSLALKGQHKPIDRITSLLMAAPDIDVDVFERQLKDIKKMPNPTAVLVSKKDKALLISGKLTGGHARIGDGSSIKVLQDNGIAVLDVSDVDGGSHDVFASSPTLMALSQDGSLTDTIMQGTGQTGGQAILADGNSVLKGTTDLILYTPVRLLSSLNK